MIIARESIEKAVANWLERLPSSAAVLNAFKEILIQEAELRDEFPVPQGRSVPNPYVDAEAYRQGVPLLGREALKIDGEQAMKIARRILPAVKQGFPQAAEDIDKIAASIEPDGFDLVESLYFAVWDQQDQIGQKADALGVDPQILALCLSRFLKPFAENMAASVPPPPDKWQWLKGYCPVCGSRPVLSVLRAPNGERVLKCAFCAHEWRFLRNACPYCENEDPDTLEMLYAEDRDSEHVAVCRKCMKYLLGVDLRKRIDDPPLEIVPFGLTYLDMIAQDAGFRPGAAGDPTGE